MMRSTLMHHAQETLIIPTHGRGFHDVTSQIRACVAKSGVRTGLCTVFVQHTSASLVIQENADPAVLRDLEAWLDRVAPDDMPAHLKSAITRASESIPISGGKLALGTWQAIYLAEHRRARHQRTVVVHVSGI
jgi:secondary thiamine-phosphate synthase enzyme